MTGDITDNPTMNETNNGEETQSGAVMAGRDRAGHDKSCSPVSAHQEPIMVIMMLFPEMLILRLPNLMVSRNLFLFHSH